MSHLMPRRHILAGMAALGLAGPASRARAAAPVAPAHPLAERLAAYADGLRYSDIDAAAIEAVKSHLIDTLGCGLAAFDERPVRICREVALLGAGGPAAGGSAAGGSAAGGPAAGGPAGATIIGTSRRASPIWPHSPTAARPATTT